MNSIQLYRALQDHIQKMSDINTRLYHAGMDTGEAKAEIRAELERFLARIGKDPR